MALPSNPFKGSDPYEIPKITEYALYLAVLARASHDLEVHVCSHERRSAITWFNIGFEGRHCPDTPVNYCDVTEHIDLDAKQVQFLKDKVHAAEEYQKSLPKHIYPEEDKFQEEGESGGVIPCPLAKRERLSVGKENGTIPREIWPSRYRGRRVI